MARPGARLARLRHARYYLDVLDESTSQYLAGGPEATAAVSRFRTERPNIEHGRRWAVRNAQADAEAARLCTDFARVGAYILAICLSPPEWRVWLDDALGAAQRIDATDYVAAHLGNLGVVHRRIGDFRTAITYYEEQIAAARDIGNRQLEAIANDNIGVANWELEDLPTALRHHRRSLSICQEIGYRRGEANALGNIGNCLADAGESDDGLEMYKQQLEIVRELGDLLGEGNALGNIGLCHRDLKAYAEAGRWFRRQLETARRVGDARGEGNALWSLAEAQFDSGHCTDAVESARAALVIFERIAHADAQDVRDALQRWTRDGLTPVFRPCPS